MRSALRVLALCAAAALVSCQTAPPRHRPPQAVPELAKAVVRTARSYLPEEERRRKTPQDCSDFVGAVFRAHGIRLPRTSAEMASAGEPVASSKDLRMGDLLFFAGSGGGRAVGHVAIYVGNGVFIHETDPVTGVRMESLYSDYYRRRYLKARRIID